MWTWVFLLVPIVVVGVFGRYRAKSLESPKKELYLLGTTFVVVGIAAAFVYFSLPSFYHYAYVPSELKTLEDARRILEDQREELSKLEENLQDFRRSFEIVLILSFCYVLPSIYHFAKALTGNCPEDKDFVSIFDKDQS